MIRIILKRSLEGTGRNFSLDVDFSITEGSFVSIYGPSGAGKTTILRMIAGLTNPEYGSIQVGDSFWLNTADKINIKPQHRSVDYAFQEHALFPNMTVSQNIQFNRHADVSEKDIEELVRAFDLNNLLNQKPNQLSGGQQQRVSLARAIVGRSRLLLLDEPFSAIDTEIRDRVIQYLKKIHQKTRQMVILVSHELLPLIQLCDHVFVLEDGKLKKEGSPQHLFLSDTGNNLNLLKGILLELPSEDRGALIQLGENLIRVNLDLSEEELIKIGEQIYFDPKSIMH